MVTVATELDIPAKLLFPRPRGPGEDPTKQAMSMLGLGDVILPGMMIGFALRFDLYLFYLRKQKRRIIQDPSMSDEGQTDASAKRHETPSDIVKAKWHPATGMCTVSSLCLDACDSCLLWMSL
jgi:minor histocompatibility antigen H13